MSSRSRSSAIAIVLAWIAVLWLVFLVQVALLGMAGIDLADVAGLRPRSLPGLWGVLGAHLLHAGLAHLVSNSIGLLVLGLPACWYSRRLTAWAVIYAALFAGMFTWLVASRGSVHVGASGVLFGLVGFLVVNGIVRRSWGALLLAIPVGLLFWLVVPGMLPTEANREQMISWQMHLGGFLGGAWASWALRHDKP